MCRRTTSANCRLLRTALRPPKRLCEQCRVARVYMQNAGPGVLPSSVGRATHTRGGIQLVARRKFLLGVGACAFPPSKPWSTPQLLGVGARALALARLAGSNSAGADGSGPVPSPPTAMEYSTAVGGSGEALALAWLATSNWARQRPVPVPPPQPWSTPQLLGVEGPG